MARDAEIIGVVEDVPYSDVTKAAEPTVYVSDAQVPTLRRSIVITAADGRPERLVPQIRAELARLDPQVPVEFEPLSQIVSTSLSGRELGLLLMVTFGVAALVLAATGVFGVIAFVAAQRSGEMAVRLALGATSGHVFRVNRPSWRDACAPGTRRGVLLAWWTGGLMGRYVYQVSPGNWLVLGGSAAIVLSVSPRRDASVGTPGGDRRQPARVLRL